MKAALCRLKSASPIAFSRYYKAERKDRELANDYEKRTWRERAHYDESGHAIITPMMFKNAIVGASRYLGMQVPGKGKRTFMKHFMAGILVTEPLVLPVTKENIQGVSLYVPSDGKVGGSSRVEKTFPIVHEWSGDVQFIILDEIIGLSVFREHLEQAGRFVGIGSLRVGNGGLFGRFSVEAVDWK